MASWILLEAQRWRQIASGNLIAPAVNLPTGGSDPFCDNEVVSLFGLVAMAGPATDRKFRSMLRDWMWDYWPQCRRATGPARLIPSGPIRHPAEFWSHAADRLSHVATSAAELQGPRDPAPWDLVSGWYDDISSCLSRCRHAIMSAIADMWSPRSMDAVRGMAPVLKQAVSTAGSCTEKIDGTVYVSVRGSRWPATKCAEPGSQMIRDRAMRDLSMARLYDMAPGGYMGHNGWRDVVSTATWTVSYHTVHVLSLLAEGRPGALDPAHPVMPIDDTLKAMETVSDAVARCASIADQASSVEEIAPMKWM